MSGLTQALAALGALGAALVAGTLFAFSTFVMPALARLPPAEATRAMQSINEVILGSAFLPVFLGTTAVVIAAAVASFFGDASPAARAALVAAAVLYVIGVIGVSAVGNIPLNDALAAFTRGDAASAWAAYYAPWMRWNHARTLASALSLCASVAALRSWAR